MTVGILSHVCQWLLSLDVSALCAEMLNHLFLLETAAKSMLIKQQVRFNSHSIIYMYNRFIKIFVKTSTIHVEDSACILCIIHFLNGLLIVSALRQLDVSHMFILYV